MTLFKLADILKDVNKQAFMLDEHYDALGFLKQEGADIYTITIHVNGKCPAYSQNVTVRAAALQALLETGCRELEKELQKVVTKLSEGD